MALSQNNLNICFYFLVTVGNINLADNVIFSPTLFPPTLRLIHVYCNISVQRLLIISTDR